MNVSLTGKVAVVTGAASGIGLATVLQFLLSGAEGVIAVDIAPDAPEPLRKIMETGQIHYMCGDVAVESTAREFTRLAAESFGRLDVLVNNAGVSVVKPLHEHTPEEWDRVMSVNVKSAYWAARHVIPVMIKQRSGVILFTGSISGVAGIPGQGAYGPSKGAIHQLSRQMAIEYASCGIRVNTIGCGTVDTPLVHRAAEESGNPAKFWAMLKDNHPIGRIAAPEEVASFITYMASDQASFFTGATIMMDGGYTAK
jgi:NAD(P)-dependent dehydrogenase (short-subunit alcohol dehydrogenase family)